MLLREFLEEDIVNFLDGISKSEQDGTAANEDEINKSLHSFEKELKKGSGSGNGSGSGTDSISGDGSASGTDSVSRDNSSNDFSNSSNKSGSSGHNEDGADALKGISSTTSDNDSFNDENNSVSDSSKVNISLNAGASTVNSVSEKSSEKEFVPPKDFQAIAPKIIIPQIKIQNNFNSSPSSDSGNVLGGPYSGNNSGNVLGGSSSGDNSGSNGSDGSGFANKNNDGLILSSQQVDDSSSLRKVIREEFSGLSDFSRPFTTSGSPSELRRTIREELNSIIRYGGISQLAPTETLKSIIHDELEKTGAIDIKKKYNPENIHIDESLLDIDAGIEDDLKVLEIMQKNPELRTRREELSLLGKLEDLLVDLKSTLRTGSQKLAVKKYRKLKKESFSLHFYLQEKRFLLDELQHIARSLFFSSRAKQGVKKVILRESTGEIMDPTDFSGAQIEKNHRPVYHLALNKKGKKSIVDPYDRSIVIHKDVFGTELRTEKKLGKLVTSRGPVSYVLDKNKPSIPSSSLNSKRKTFFLIEKSGRNNKNKVINKKFNARENPSLFSSDISLTEKEKKEIVSEQNKNFDERNEDMHLVMNTKGVNPWEDKKQQMHNPFHTKGYLKALRAIRHKDKEVAVSILTDLHNKYPRNVAIKVRLNDALEL